MSPPAIPLPTILAFHGGGSNSTIHTVQLARLTRVLKSTFQFLPLESPFPSAAGPGILPFFDGCGPYKRWVPPSESGRPAPGTQIADGKKEDEFLGLMSQEVEETVLKGVREVYEAGGKVVGVVGFSQGTRIGAGILRAVELYRALKSQGNIQGGDGKKWEWLDDIKFGLSLAGSYPPPLVPPSLFTVVERELREEVRELVKRKIRMPTLHVQGSMDEWEWAGRLLIEGCFEVGEGMSTVRVLEIGHYYPVKPEDNEGIRDWVVQHY